MDHPADNPATKQLGRYELLGELGRGAMGVVYKARDPHIDRLVALKTITMRGQEPEEEQEFRRRFLNEAQAAGRLHHPGIVSVFDVGEDPETNDPFIVLEYVAGEALNRILAREKKLPLPRALQLAEEIASALDYAHEQGVVHRDIKPGNILITQDGHPKIADFGIAKLNLAHFTLPGRVLGTPAYMAPEQLSGEGADGRSDLFSLGVILYLMVTGHSPFQGDSATTVCFKVANREPLPASALDLDLPHELDAVIGRAMAKDPNERYQRGSDFGSDIAQLQTLQKSGGTTTSLQSIAAKGTRARQTGQTSALGGHPAVGLAYAVKLVRGAFRRAPVKDLILGVATVVMLVIAGVQSKLLVISRQETKNTAEMSQARAYQLQNGPIPSSPVQPGTGSATATQTAPPAVPLQSTVAETRAPDSNAAIAPAKPTLRKASAKAPPKIIAASPRTVVVPLSTVELAIRHQFKDATLSVWVDDKLALTRQLHGGTQKRLVVFSGVRGIESETLKIPAGKHVLRVEAQTADQTLDLSKTMSAEFIGGNDRTLQITFDKHNTAMHLEWQ